MRSETTAARAGRRASPEAAALAALALAVPKLLSATGIGDYASLKEGLRRVVARDPMDATFGTVLGASYLFWLAEREANPQVRSFWDALVFVSTCLSVGYAQTFAVTPSGKAIASFLMTAGPSLTARFFDAPRTDAPPPAAAGNADEAAWRDAVLARLDTLAHAMTRTAEGPAA